MGEHWTEKATKAAMAAAMEIAQQNGCDQLEVTVRWDGAKPAQPAVPEGDKGTLVGSLLDAWQGTPNDLKGEMREFGCGRQLDALEAFMDNPETNPPPPSWPHARRRPAGGREMRDYVPPPPPRRPAVPDGLPEHVRDALREVERATVKFPTWPTDPLHAVAVLGEEFGELTKAVLQCVYEPGKSTVHDVREEAVQVAAMALRFLASLDAYRYRGSAQHHQLSREQQEEKP